MSETYELPHPQRWDTGIEGLDILLKGGLLSGSVFLLQGSPGSGKTILANQICFHHVREKHQALYFTLLSESHGRLLQQIQALDFYDPHREHAVHYLSGYAALEREGSPGLLKLLGEEARQRHASFIVLDGISALLESLDSEAQLRHFMNGLSALAEVLNCTMLLLTSSTRSRDRAEYTLVDGWIELEMHAQEIRRYRTLEIHKYRRSDYISGRHFFTVGEAGIEVFPRIENTVGRDSHPPVTEGRLESGIPDLDTMIGGGIPRTSTTLIVGPTGIGKTTLGLHFLSQCTKEAPGLVFGFYQTQERLLAQAKLLGIDLENLMAADALKMVWQPPTEHTLDQLGYRLLKAAKRLGAKRIFIDGLNAFKQSAVFPNRLERFLAALMIELQQLGATVVCTYEVPELIGGETRVVFGPISAVAQNILLLRYVELESDTKRIMNFVKVRSSRFDSAIREFHITEKGVHIGRTFKRAEALLTGHGHRRQSNANKGDTDR